MHRRLAVIAALATVLAGPALASDAPKKDVGQYVDLSPVGLPIVANGQLVNYVFVYVRINLTGGANTSKWREKEPYFRDALVRAAHRTPFTKAGDYSVIDTDKLTGALTREAVAITGPGVVKQVVVSSQAPRWRPRGAPAPAKVAAAH